LTAHVEDQTGTGEAGPAVRGREREEQSRRIIVEAVKRHPGYPANFGGGPFDEEGRLAVARRRRDRHETAATRTSSLNEIGAANGPRARLRDRELRVEQQMAELRS